MPLSDVDRKLLSHCFQRRLFAWESFVDRYLMLTAFVVRQTAQRRQVDLTEDETFELVSDVFLTLVRDDFALLRRFRGKSSLATYLTVLTRRVVVRKLLRTRKPPGTAPRGEADPPQWDAALPGELDAMPVEALVQEIEPAQASILRMFHIERKSMSQISASTGLTEDAIREQLQSARGKLRQDADARQGA